MEKTSTPYKRQIFVCTHQGDGQKASCGDCDSQEVFDQLRAIAKERKLHPNIRVAQAKCLGQCEKGVNIMIYPENVWISKATTGDVVSIADAYII